MNNNILVCIASFILFNKTGEFVFPEDDYMVARINSQILSSDSGI